MKRAVVPRHERARKRQSVGPLSCTLVKAATQNLYMFSLKLFRLWLRFHALSWPEDGDELDLRVCEFGEAAWEEGEGRQVFANLVSGIRHFEQSLKLNLFAARRLITAWDRAEYVTRSFPVTLLMCEAMAGLALHANWFYEAAAILIGFSGLFRVMELLTMKAWQVSGSTDDECLVVELPDTKTSKRKSAKERAIIHNPYAALLLTTLLSDLQPGDLIFAGLTPKVLRDRIRLLTDKLGMKSLFISPHSLRRGAATSLFRETGSFDQVAAAGRWDSIRTCRKYVDEAVTELGAHVLHNQSQLAAAALLMRKSF